MTMLTRLLLLLLALALPAQAQERSLRIAFGDPLSSLDPQLNNLAGDRSAELHFFDLLVEQKYERIQGGLAESWRVLDPLTWEFTLRPGIKWSDGQELTADDVVFSYGRAGNVPGAVVSFANFLRTIASVEATGRYTLRITTKEPNPLLPLNLASVHVVSRHVGQGAASEDYNSGRGMVGTGPFVFESYIPGDRVLMRRNPLYWRPAPEWDRVEYRYIANPTTRTAALLAGDVDVIDKVALADVARLRANPATSVFAYPGLRVMLLQPSFTPGPNRYITGADGKPLPENPLLDVRVRQALNLAVNRTALVDRLMLGAAVAAGQWMPAGTFGYNPDVKLPAFDPDAARRLLAEAGFPQGFNLTMHVPTDRYTAGVEVAQAVAQMWTRIGVRTTVETMTGNIYGSRVTKGEFAVTMIAWGNGTGEASYGLVNVLGSVDPALGRGANNWGRYSSPAVDRAIDEATSAFDDAKRDAILRASVQAVADDVAIFPLFHYQNVWAARKGLKVTPMTSDRTVAEMVTTER